MRPSREAAFAGATLLLLLLALGLIWLPHLPDSTGHTGPDYGFWFPNLLAGYFWYLHNGLLSLPWVSPAECAGEPFQADPQIGYFALPQLLTFIMDPLQAVRLSFFAYAAAGFGGAWLLARKSFAMPPEAAVLSAGLFTLNGFFTARFAIGHLAFLPFMLLPGFCAALLPAPAPARGNPAPPGRAALVLRGLAAGAILALTLHSGMAVLLPHFAAAALAVLLLHATLQGWRPALAIPPLVAAASFLCLGAGKLAASLALLSNFPRQDYPLPGIAGLPATFAAALRALFLPAGHDLGSWVTNTPIIQDPHEFAYGVGLAVPLLLACAAVAGLRAGLAAFRPARPRLALALTLLLLLPLALNTYAPGWNALLKALPVLNSSSTGFRWFTLWILPATLAAGLVLPRCAATLGRRPALLTFGALALTAAGAASDASASFPLGRFNIYDPTDILHAWHQAHEAGAPIPVTAVAMLFNAQHRPLMTLERQNGMAHGFSTLGCYDPLFGYRLERLPVGRQRLGPALLDVGGALNFKNPACYIWPGANHCAPGDQFLPDQAGQLSDFLNYRPYPIARPLAARLAEWLSLLSLFALPALGFWCWRRRG